MQHKDSPSQYNVVQILSNWVFQTLKTSNLYLFDKCSIWDNVWVGNLIFCVFFFTNRQKGQYPWCFREKVKGKCHSSQNNFSIENVCYGLASQTLSVCLSVSDLSVLYIPRYTPRMLTQRHNSYPQGTIQVWDFKIKKKRILLKGFFRSRIVCVYKSTWFS